jgi:hypothetical protein
MQIFQHNTNSFLRTLNSALIALPGLVETGLFIGTDLLCCQHTPTLALLAYVHPLDPPLAGMTEKVFIGNEDGTVTTYVSSRESSKL